MFMKMKGCSSNVKRIAMIQIVFLHMKQIFYRMKKTYKKLTNIKNREMNYIKEENTKKQ